jgi:hypothetical protein
VLATTTKIESPRRDTPQKLNFAMKSIELQRGNNTHIYTPLRNSEEEKKVREGRSRVFEKPDTFC